MKQEKIQILTKKKNKLKFNVKNTKNKFYILSCSTIKLIFPMRNNVLQTRETSKHELSRLELAHTKVRLHASRIF